MSGIVEGGCTPPQLPTRWRRVLVLLAVVLGLAAGLGLVFVR